MRRSRNALDIATRRVARALGCNHSTRQLSVEPVMTRPAFMGLVAGALVAAIASVTTLWLTDPPVCPRAEQIRTVIVGAEDQTTTIYKTREN
jgi:hypothetical protein